MRFVVPVTLAVFAPSLFLLACVGDSPTVGDAGPRQGEENGSCFPNGTCNAGLACVLPGRCERATSDAGPADTGVLDARVDSGPCALLAWWRAEQSPKDERGAYDLQWSGLVTYMNGFSFTGAEFLKNDKPISTKAITVEARIIPTLVGSGTIFATDTVSGVKGVWFGLIGGKLSARINGMPCQGDATLVASTPHHVAVTYKASTCAFYLDGNPDGMRGIAAGDLADDLGPRVGANALSADAGGGNVNHYTGSIDELAVWDHALSPAEILKLSAENPPVKCN
jgi:hypothetical protein